MHETEARSPSCEKAPCYWTLHDHDYGHDVGCRSAKVFLAHLLSPGTHEARLIWHNSSHSKVRIVILGSVADDFERLSLGYDIHAEEFHEVFNREEKTRFVAGLLQLWGEPNRTGYHPVSAVMRSLNLGWYARENHQTL